ncbi:MAG TPA: alpha/beta hydrolase [Solirubrobacteraceae bacterium]|nr:alpha/beta hydrolase [Solirubrobacteraceae bacterium]
MTQVRTPGGIALEYETYGDPTDPPMLLVAGFGSQLISWGREFCRHLAGGGLHVIAYDNRDTGLSTRFHGAPAPLEEIAAAAGIGDFDRAAGLAAYTLADLADDAIGLLDALELETVHLLGASMGGMIAQLATIRHPERIRTLTSMFSTTGEREYGQAAPGTLEVLFTPAPTERAAYIEHSAQWLIWHSKRYPEPEATREEAAAAFDRGLYPEGVRRQMAALFAAPPRTDGLAAITVPTLVLHGTDDTLITPSGGERTAELIPGARWVLIEDMGHDRPRPLWDAICQPIWELTGVSG